MRLFFLCLSTVLLSFALPYYNSLSAMEHIWIEGENPSSMPTVLKTVDDEKGPHDGHGFQIEGWGNTAMISAGTLLHVNMSSAEVDKHLPESGLIFGYDFTISAAAREQHIWARIGYEFARSEFEWRIDTGEWHSVANDVLTINIQPIQVWNELAWLKLGSQKLSAGKHTLSFRHQRTTKKDKKGKEKTQRILHMLDAIYITPETFAPSGKWAPDTSHENTTDSAAAKKVFAVNTTAGNDGRAWTQLDGLWQYAAWGEIEFPINDDTRLRMPHTLPALDQLRWFAYTAPGDRDSSLPEQGLCHRYLLRCQLDVPADAKNKGFFLDIQRSSLLTAVFVNGHFAGDTDTFHTAWQMDLSQYIQAGKKNELVLAFKDAYYSLNPTSNNKAKTYGHRYYWNRPRDFLSQNQGTATHHDLPIASDVRSGILEPASIVVCGKVYVEDAFIMPSVKNKNVKTEVTVFNPNKKPATIVLQQTVIPWSKGAGGAVECTLPESTIQLAAGEYKTIKLSQKWNDPQLWWPDNPHLYWLQSDILIDGTLVDRQRSRFGFREWTWDTHMFVLNGVKWPMWADTNYAPTVEAMTEKFKKTNQNQVRLWSHDGWGDKTRREALNYFDETGMLVRESGTFDGQLANYSGGLREPDMSKEPDKHGRYPWKAKTRLWNAWRKQMTAWIKEERNHASIYIWSVENEITYINIANLGLWRECEPEIRKGVEHVMALDPTRPAMVDGGNALHDESLPVNGAHYTELISGGYPQLRDFPDGAYGRDHFYDLNNLQRNWRMVPNRPIMKGEVLFANGYSPARLATIGGDKCFIGIGETLEARGLMARMLSEGYRWSEIASFHFWMINSDYSHWNSWSPVAVFCRQWNWSWGSEQKIQRDLKVFNSTRHADPIEVSWTFTLAGKEISSASKIFNVAPGEAEAFSIQLQAPAVQQRSSGELRLVAKRKGEIVFTDSKKISVLAPMNVAKSKIAGKKLIVIDPDGSCIAHLKRRGIAHSVVSDPTAIPKNAEVVIVGHDAIAADASTDNVWMSLASSGKKVIILDQSYPLAYQGLPGDLRTTTHSGRIGFSSDLSHPIFAGMDQSDFFTWGNDHIVYRNAYKKGTTGGRSLFQCDDSLSHSALFESQLNDGLLVLCQLNVTDKLASEGCAQQVFNNILNYAIDYTPLRKATTTVFAAGDKRLALLESIKLQSSNDDTHNMNSSLMDSFSGNGIAIIDANPQNLKILAENKKEVDAFCERGGWLILWGLTPDGLTSYNTIVGFKHAIRPFATERVLLSYPQDSLAAGLSLSDVVMDTGEKMFGWMALKKPDQTAFKWLVDHTDIAPFSKFPTPIEMGKTSNEDPGFDHWPRNMVNGFTSADSWRFTYTMILDKGHKTKFTLELPKEETITAIQIRPSKYYHPITKINIYFDDDPTPVVAIIPVRQNPIVEDIPIAGRKASRITIEIAEWAKRGTANIVVIDNLWLQVERSPEYRKNVRSLLNIGALMKYQRGAGGIILNQINLPESEVNPDNSIKKSTIVKTLIKNVGGVFIGADTTVDRIIYDYQAISLPSSALTAYPHQKGEPSWFGTGDIAAMPVGERIFSGIPFSLPDFSTSPVPAICMLSGDGSETKIQEVKDIVVNRKVDTLSFLHTFHEGAGIGKWRRHVLREKKSGRPAPKSPHVLSYIVHYKDGSTENIPVLYGQHISTWDAAAKPLPQGRLAWAGTQENGNSAAAWIMTWVNPHPQKIITSITIRRAGNKHNGAAAVFGIVSGVKK